MDAPFTATGGARIGWANATWPFAKLTVTPSSLQLAVQILGDYTFTPATVVAITTYTLIPVIGWGVRIHHCSPDCPARVIFWHFGRPETLLASIQNAGFKPQAPADELSTPSDLAFRWQVIALTALLWLALTLSELRKIQNFLLTKEPPFPGPFAVLAIGLLLAATIATLRLPAFQRLILKPGRSVGEIRPFLNLLLLVGSLLFPILLLVVIITQLAHFS